jgi:hypothetical protein
VLVAMLLLLLLLLLLPSPPPLLLLAQRQAPGCDPLPASPSPLARHVAAALQGCSLPL